MASFYIPQLKSVLPILKASYGFDTIEISRELAESLQPYVDERKLDEIAQEQLNKGEKKLLLLDYAINIDGEIEMSTSDNFAQLSESIKNLCNQHLEDEAERDTTTFILTFMAAIFDRDTNFVHPEDLMRNYRKHWSMIHPDMLRLFIALNKPRHRNDTPIRISYKTDSPHLIENREGWLSSMLNAFIRQVLGKMSIEQAEEDLKKYSDERGRKSSNPYLNYIIHGTYNHITHFLKSDNGKVTVEQCRFLLEYLKIIGQVQDGDTLANLNTLQSTVRSLINSSLTPVDKHIKETMIA